MTKTIILGIVVAAVIVAGLIAFMPMVKEVAGAAGGLLPFGNAQAAMDPLDPTNHVWLINTLPDESFGGLSTNLNVKIDDLDDKLSLEFFLLGMECVGGSPRIQLRVDTDGDGNSNGNAFGYLGATNNAFEYICPQESWTFEDLTDSNLHWDLTQFGGGFTNSWDDTETFFNTNFPSHKVLRGTLVADEFGPPPNMQGFSFYDDITIG